MPAEADQGAALESAPFSQLQHQMEGPFCRYVAAAKV
jgi:hypothetical protein